MLKATSEKIPPCGALPINATWRGRVQKGGHCQVAYRCVRHPDETERTFNHMNLEAFERVREIVGREAVSFAR
jgi:hypothetical protein